MTVLTGFVAYCVTVWAALTLYDYLAHRRRVAEWHATKDTP